MTKDRLLAFSDGCIAIFITIILLTFDMPEGATFSDLRSVVPAYGIVAISCTITYMILEKAIMDAQVRMSKVYGQCGEGKCLKLILGNRYKEYMALVLYAVGIIVAFYYPIAAIGCYVIVNIAWFVPDRRIARAFHIRALEEKDRADQEMAEEEMKAAAAAGAHHSAN